MIALLLLIVFCLLMLIHIFIRITLRIECVTDDGKAVPVTYQFTKESFRHIWLTVKSVFGSDGALCDFMVAIMGRWDDAPRKLWLGNKLILYVSNPDDLQIILNSSNMLEKGEAYKVMRGIFGNGLITATVPVWKKFRRHVATVFTSQKMLENYYDVFNERTKFLTAYFEEKCENGEKFDAWESVSTTTFRMIKDVIIGDEPTISPSDEKRILEGMVVGCDLYGSRIYRPWLRPRRLFKLYIKIKGLEDDLKYKDWFIERKCAEKIDLLEKRKALSPNMKNTAKTDMVEEFIDKFLEGEYSEKEVVDQVLTLCAGGSEPPALLISFTLLMLAANPAIQEKAYEEVSALINNEEQFITPEILQQMKYLEMCLKETLRRYPPVPFTIRRATADVKISKNFTIESDVDVIIPHFLFHRSAKHFQNPNEWDPENFNEQAEKSRHKFSFLPFSAGPRGCIGNHYALAASKVAVAKILIKYRLSTDIKPENVKLRMDLVLRSVNGYPIRVQRR